MNLRLFIIIFVTLFLLNTPYAKSEESIESISLDNIPLALAINPNTNKVYLINISTDTVSVFDIDTSMITENIEIGARPKHISVNSQTNKIYVNSSNGLLVINGFSNVVESAVQLNEEITDMEINLNINKIYFTVNNKNKLIVINGETNSVETTIILEKDGLAFNPSTLAINSNTNKVYVGSNNKTDLLVINGLTNEIETSIFTGLFTSDIAINPLTNKIYLTNEAFDVVAVVNGETNKREKELGFKDLDPSILAVNPTINRLYVTTKAGKIVFVVDGEKDRVIDFLILVKNAIGVAVNPITNILYIAELISQRGTSNLTIVNSSSKFDSINQLGIKLLGAVSNVQSVHNELLINLESLRAVNRNINLALGRIISSISQKNKNCTKNIARAYIKFLKSLALLEKKKCNESEQDTKCVSPLIVQDFALKIEIPLGIISLAIFIDDNDDNILNVCEVID